MMLIQWFGGNPTLNDAPGTCWSRDLRKLDTDKDGKVSPGELAAFYRRWDAGPFVTVGNNSRGATENQLTSPLRRSRCEQGRQAL